MKYKNLVFIIATLGLLPEMAFSSEYATVQYTENALGLSYLVFQEAEGDEEFCRALNQNFIRGLRTNCTSCVVESQSCDRNLPSAYRDIFSNVPGALPYISAPHLRIVIFGSPNAIDVCRERAEQLQRGLNQQAQCVYE